MTRIVAANSLGWEVQMFDSSVGWVAITMPMSKAQATYLLGSYDDNTDAEYRLYEALKPSEIVEKD